MNASLPIADRAAGDFTSSAKPALPAATQRKRHSTLVRVTH